MVALRGSGRNLTTAQAADAIYGYAVGVDLTRRDLQADAKKGGRPWDTAKGFDFSGPVGAVTPKNVIDYTSANGKLVTKVNGANKQQAQISDMIWSIPEMISNISQLYTLMPGDILFTGKHCCATIVFHAVSSSASRHNDRHACRSWSCSSGQPGRSHRRWSGAVHRHHQRDVEVDSRR